MQAVESPAAPVEAPAEDSAPAADAATPPGEAADPASENETGEDDPNRPRKRGWWQRSSKFLGLG